MRLPASPLVAQQLCLATQALSQATATEPLVKAQHDLKAHVSPVFVSTTSQAFLTTFEVLAITSSQTTKAFNQAVVSSHPDFIHFVHTRLSRYSIVLLQHDGR
jgi:hypothetical protein